MEHSIAARFATRPKARFVQPTAGTRERRLGLGRRGFNAAGSRVTVLHQIEPGPLERLRASGRSMRAAPTRPVSTGGPRPAVSIRWTRPARSRSVRRPSAASAPWLG